MFRLLVVIAAIVFAIECTSANAQGRSRRGYRGPSSSFGLSIGIGSYPSYGYSRFGAVDPYRFDGYGYDPYRYGSFRAPDLLDDPYFRARHKFDSRFPGRYRTRAVVRPTAPPATYRSHGPATAYTDNDATQGIVVNPADLAGQLDSASQQLLHSLSTRQNGDSWIEYLAPHQISQMIASGNTAEVRELLTHYDGVVANPQLRSIVAVSGFGTTRSLLRQYVKEPIEPTIESLPIPEPIALPDSLPEGDFEN